MRSALFLVVASSLSALPGCTEKPPESAATDTTATLAGEVYYLERKMLPPGAELHVVLEDVSKMDVAATEIASSVSVLTGAPPYAFTVEYSPADIEARMRYGLRARIMLDEQLLFTSTEHIDPFREEAINIKLSMVGSPNTRQQAAEADAGLAVVSVNPLAELSNTYWKLISLNGSDINWSEGQEREAFLQLRDEEKRANGFAGCNSFTGSYQVNGNDLSFGPLAATRKACQAGMDTEDEFLQVLEDTAYYSIHEETLTLLDEQMKPIGRLMAVYFE